MEVWDKEASYTKPFESIRINYDWSMSKPIGADINGDGNDDMVIFYYYYATNRTEMHYFEAENDANGTRLKDYVVLFGSEGPNWNNHRAQYVSGDFDNDNKDEIIARYQLDTSGTYMYLFDGLTQIANSWTKREVYSNPSWEEIDDFNDYTEINWLKVEKFEDYSTNDATADDELRADDWTLNQEGGNISIAQNMGNGGKSLKLDDNIAIDLNGNSNRGVRVTKNFSALETVKIEFDWRFNAKKFIKLYAQGSAQTQGASGTALTFAFGYKGSAPEASSYFEYWNGSDYVNLPTPTSFSLNTWYHMEFYLNTYTDTVSVYIDRKFKGDIAFRNKTTNISQFYITTQSGPNKSISWIDNFNYYNYRTDTDLNNNGWSLNQDGGDVSIARYQYVGNSGQSMKLQDFSTADNKAVRIIKNFDSQMGRVKLEFDWMTLASSRLMCTEVPLP